MRLTRMKVGESHGIFRFIFPIPSRISGCWYKRQWGWYKFAVKKLICFLRGHKLILKKYVIHTEGEMVGGISFGNKRYIVDKGIFAVECSYCSSRFAIDEFG